MLAYNFFAVLMNPSTFTDLNTGGSGLATEIAAGRNRIVTNKAAALRLLFGAFLSFGPDVEGSSILGGLRLFDLPLLINAPLTSSQAQLKFKQFMSRTSLARLPGTHLEQRMALGPQRGSTALLGWRSTVLTIDTSLTPTITPSAKLRLKVLFVSPMAGSPGCSWQR